MTSTRNAVLNSLEAAPQHAPRARRRRFIIGSAALMISASALGGCVSTVVGGAVGAAVTAVDVATDVAVGAVNITTDVVGSAASIVIPGGDDEDD